MSKNDTFFSKANCDRCSNKLVSRKLSWFTEDVICMDCSIREGHLKKALYARGEDINALEGCGYIPQVEKIEDITG